MVVFLLWECVVSSGSRLLFCSKNWTGTTDESDSLAYPEEKEMKRRSKTRKKKHGRGPCKEKRAVAVKSVAAAFYILKLGLGGPRQGSVVFCTVL